MYELEFWYNFEVFDVREEQRNVCISYEGGERKRKLERKKYTNEDMWKKSLNAFCYIISK